MAREQSVYTARMKRADVGSAEAKRTKGNAQTEIKQAAKKPAARAVEVRPAAKRAPGKGEKAAEKKPADKNSAAKKAAQTGAARLRPAAKAEPAEKKPEKRRVKEEPVSRRQAREREKARVAANERKRAISRSAGFGVVLITLLTVAFDVLGLMLCAVRGSVLDTQALSLAVLMAAAAVMTAILLPRWISLDPVLMALNNFLCGVSVVILYTVAPERGAKQAMFYAVGLLVMIIMHLSVSRLKKWRGITLLAMLLGIGALILPLAFGQWSYGAKNWVQVPFIGSFQPSEAVKISLVIALAYYFSAHRTVLQMMPALIFAAACLLLLMLQRDLGTALIYYMTTLIMFYAACGNVPLTLMGLGGGVGAAAIGYEMFAHVKVRVAMWQNPWSDALDKGYQIIQALLAIGSGGLFGVGLGQGTPDKIPAYYNDFIFAVICEQLGIVFGLCVIAVYVLMVLRGMSVCLRSRRSFDLLLGCGVASMLGIQTFMIVAGVIKMIPLTGVTMPFLSHGGSSLISCMAMMGILHGIGAKAQDELEDDILHI